MKFINKIASVFFAAIIFIAAVSSNVTQGFAQTNIKIGDYLQMGTYYGKPILWRCVDIDENGPLMLSDKILCLKAFDASGTNVSGSHGRGHTDNEVKGYFRMVEGSNYWGDSNIRSWLNSTVGPGKVVWGCGNPPNKENIWKGLNAYDQEAGFLSKFTSEELALIKEVTQKSLLDGYEYSEDRNKDHHNWDYYIGNNTPGSGEIEINTENILYNYDTAYSENIKDRMFLIDVKQACKIDDNLPGYRTKTYPTEEAIANSEIEATKGLKDDFLDTMTYYQYWLRSPGNIEGSSYNVITSGFDGLFVLDSVNRSDVGVRPAFYLNQDTLNVKSGSGSENVPYVGYGTLEKKGTSSSKDIKIILNGKEIDTSKKPVIIDNRTYVPLRAVMGKMGCEIIWDAEIKQAIVEKDNIKITVNANPIMNSSPIVKEDSSSKELFGSLPKPIEFEGKPFEIIDGSVYVPMRVIAEGLGADVSWEAAANSVIIFN